MCDIFALNFASPEIIAKGLRFVCDFVCMKVYGFEMRVCECHVSGLYYPLQCYLKIYMLKCMFVDF